MQPEKEAKGKLSMLFIILPGIMLVMVLYALVRPHGHYTSAAAGCINRLRQIDAAKEQWALEQHKTTNDVPTWNDLYPYLSSNFTNNWFTNGIPVCPGGGICTIGRIGEPPVCSFAMKRPYQHTLP